MLSNEQLFKKRKKGDPLADDVIKKIIQSENGYQVAELFNTLTQNVDVPVKDLPPEVIEYFEKTKELPDYFDPKLIKIAQEVFSIHGPAISMILLCKSLPQCYACGKGAKVLYHTGRLVEHDDNFELLTRRLMETSQFVINVLAPNSFADDGKAIINTQKVRLIHAAIRYFINQSGRWDEDHYGVAINQEDMAGTLMSFSALILEGLDQIGIELTTEEKNGYFHLWRVVGHIQGVDTDLIPETPEEGIKLGYAIFDQQLLSTKEGTSLTSSAIKFMQSIVPGQLFDKLPEEMVYFFLGPKVAESVGLVKPAGCLQQVLPDALHKFFNLLDKTEEDLPGLQKVTKKFNRIFLQGMLNYFNKGKQSHFYIPPSLQKDWKLND